MFSRACLCTRNLTCLAIFFGGLGTVLPLGATSEADRSPATASFSTRLGTFTPQPWSALAGWSQESHAEALDVFRRTCRSLQRRVTWRGTCAAAQSTASDPGAAREFFEGQFVPYLVRPIEQGKEGLMTGYFEPILEGSPLRKAPFVVPVHGVPADLLRLDTRRWQGVATDGKVRATIRGSQVLPIGAQGQPDGAPEARFEVDPAVFQNDPLDRRFRVRRDGNRIVPYWTRQQIEAGAATGVPVIAWVDDPQSLYLMQVQGSGQIRMPGGRRIRLSYADQNGHPFRPRGLVATASRTRGLPGSEAGDSEPVAVVTPISMRTLSMVGSDSGAVAPVRKKPAPAANAASSEKGAAAANAPAKEASATSVDARGVLNHDVERIIDALLAQQSPRSAAQSRAPAPVPDPVRPAREGDARVTTNLRYLVAARENDPSYVFFQPAASGGSGPVGALGVPLTATRSIAVDPRSTPLGAPVFIEAERDDASGTLRRLMIAQDTGGAIRGAVRADFFWGTGPQAGAQAVRTRDDLAMWVLLPKNFSRPKGSGTRTRGVGEPPAAECVMPDSDYCLE